MVIWRGVTAACYGVILTLCAVTGPLAPPAGFAADGVLRAGWCWLQEGAQSATWMFNATGLRLAEADSVYLNFAPLVTNRVGGGSGFDTVCTATVTGELTIRMAIPVTNPYRPRDTDPAPGVGYQCYGHSAAPLPRAVWQGAERLTVTVRYPSSSGYPFAVRRDAMTLGYSRRDGGAAELRCE